MSERPPRVALRPRNLPPQAMRWRWLSRRKCSQSVAEAILTPAEATRPKESFTMHIYAS